MYLVTVQHSSKVVDHPDENIQGKITLDDFVEHTSSVWTRQMQTTQPRSKPLHSSVFKEVIHNITSNMFLNPWAVTPLAPSHPQD